MDKLFDYFSLFSKEKLEKLQAFILNEFDLESNVALSEFKNVAQQILDDTNLVPLISTLRGVLSFDILKTCLLRRHRINYGIDRINIDTFKLKERTKLAVPFQAKDTPSPTVEFAQPDVAVLFTLLAYYSDGLSEEQVRECFIVLKKQGNNERKKNYKSWYMWSKHQMDKEDAVSLLDVEGINIENTSQMLKLVEYYRHNFELVNFYLNHFVFPQQTKQFPTKIVATSWDIAKAFKVVGFSGTDDTKYILPQCVKQTPLEKLEATNGKMLDVLTNTKNQGFNYVPTGTSITGIMQEMLSKREKQPWNVLIDCGALIEGVSNEQVVKLVLQMAKG
jgi:hypothetical protein